MIKSVRRSLFAFTCGVLLSSAAAAEIVVDDAYVREPIPGRNMSAAFMQIRNTGSEDEVLVSASAPWTGRIEIHTHIHEDGVMKMRQIESLPVPAGETVVLKPMGLHLMLFELKQPLADTLPLKLCMKSGECVETEAQLRKPE